jgi:hypothetical protein
VHNDGCSLLLKISNAHGQQVLVVKPEGKKDLGKSRRRCEDSTMDFIGIERRSVDRCHHDQDRAHFYPSVEGMIQHWAPIFVLSFLNICK